MHAVVHTPLGPLYLTAQAGRLNRCAWTPPADDSAPTETDIDTLNVLAEAECQLQAYFAGQITRFNLPVSPQGTPFCQRVWLKLLTIPYGSTVSYSRLAALMGLPKGSQRAVARACSLNPLAVIVPCHRVISANGETGGYTAVPRDTAHAGSHPRGKTIKSSLLALEAKAGNYGRDGVGEM
ncbi:MAG: methylated-DNA--[protein]-cysteine S-methyltransferase [Muribaculaceae bacterium]|nr:methylated-DNA--[protein]-cysteine S-methyltransferase [Muribaculaceae bacterium]